MNYIITTFNPLDTQLHIRKIKRGIMPAKPIDRHWEQRIYEMSANDSRAGPYRIEAALAEDAIRLPFLPPPPVANTIRKYLRIWAEKGEEEKTPYQYLRWPQSMTSGALPWEASSAALELLSIVPPPQGNRPSVRIARWFWRVTQAAPDMPLMVLDFSAPIDRFSIAQLLAEWEILGDPPSIYRDSVEAVLTYAPWRSEDNAGRYAAALQDGSVPPLPYPNWISASKIEDLSNRGA